jgi:hypothetical protein
MTTAPKIVLYVALYPAFAAVTTRDFLNGKWQYAILGKRVRHVPTAI